MTNCGREGVLRRARTTAGRGRRRRGAAGRPGPRTSSAIPGAQGPARGPAAGRRTAAQRRPLAGPGLGRQAKQVGLGALQTAVSRLRSWLGTFDDPDLVLDSDGSGYRLCLRPEAVDLGRFRRAVERGDLAAAVALRRGPVFADAVRVSHADPLLRTVEEDVRAAVLAWARAALEDGSPQAALPHLDALARDTPLDEPVQAARMRLLAADGRPAEALRLYQALRQQVVDELGVEPGAQVREAYSEVLAQDRDVRNAPLRPLPVPAQLPPDTAAFVGRERGTARIREALAAGRLPVIAGMGGIGKTALAVRLANRVRGDFPDGQLYVDLRGAGTDPADPGLVLSGFLRALGVEPGQIPETTADRAALAVPRRVRGVRGIRRIRRARHVWRLRHVRRLRYVRRVRYARRPPGRLAGLVRHRASGAAGDHPAGLRPEPGVGGVGPGGLPGEAQRRPRVLRRVADRQPRGPRRVPGGRRPARRGGADPRADRGDDLDRARRRQPDHGRPARARDAAVPGVRSARRRTRRRRRPGDGRLEPGRRSWPRRRKPWTTPGRLSPNRTRRLSSEATLTGRARSPDG